LDALSGCALLVRREVFEQAGLLDEACFFSFEDLDFALAARAAVYGEDIEYSGPLAREVTREGSSLRVWFDHATSGLESRGGALRSFEVAGADGSFIAADARIERSTLVVSAPGIDAPVHVRYGWSNSPECRLYNREGLPASPFTVSR